MSLWYNFGYNMLIFSAGIENISQHFYEVAAIDGATISILSGIILVILLQRSLVKSITLIGIGGR